MNELEFMPGGSFFGPDMEPPSGIHTRQDVTPEPERDAAPPESSPERAALEKELRARLRQAQRPVAAPSLRMALEASSGLTSEQIAQADRAARSVGIPTKWALHAPPDVSRIVIAERRINESALLAHWAKMSEEHAALARDDAQALAGVAGSLGSFAVGYDADAERDTAKFTRALLSGGHGVLSGLAHAFRLRHEMAYGENAYLTEFVRGVDALAPEPVQADTRAGRFFLDFVETAPQMFATAAAGAVAGPVGPALMGAGLTAGSAYRDLRGKGVSIDRAGLSSLLNAAFSAPLETVSAGKFLDLFKVKGIREIVRKTAESMISEGGTEYLQGYVDFVAGLWGEASLHGRDESEQLAWFVQEATNPQRLAEVHAQSLNDALVGMAWGGAVGGVRGGLETSAKAAQARTRAAALMHIHDKLEATKIKKLSPDLTRGMLEDMNPDLSRQALIPADEAMAFFQSGTDILTPLGIAEEDARVAANLGQSLEVPISEMLARLDRSQMEAAARIMSVDERGMSVAEADERDANLEEDAEEVTRLYNEYAAEQSAYDAERERLRADLTNAVELAPKLKAQAESMAGGVGAYADAVLEPVEGFARRMEAAGVPRAETLSRIRLDLDALARSLEERGLEGLKKELGRAPLVQQIWGRLDGKLLGRDYPGVYKELVRLYGPGLFKKGGLAPDLLADELVRAGLLPEGSGANEMIESLRNEKAGGWFQLSEEDVRLAERKLARDVEAWGKTVDGIAASGKAPSSAVRMLTQTPLVMRLLGTDTATGKAASEGGIYAAPHMFDGTHPNMTPDMWKQIPAAMADPVAIFDSDSPRNRVRGDIVFMLDIKDANGATVVVPVALEGRGTVPGVAINIVKSAYTKENEGEPSNVWFKKQAKKNARYINEQKLKSWQASAGVYFPFTLLTNSSGNRVFTEADLVKLKNAYPGYYQTAYHGTPHRFDEFSLDAIGTGEGAQAHGWGLYFAADRKVGEGYKNRLTDRFSFSYKGVKGEHLKPSSEETQAIRAVLKDFYDGKASDLAEAYNGQIQEQEKILADEHAAEWQKNMASDRLAALKDIDINQLIVNTGQLFEVDIPENDVLLDEQKTLEEQPHIAKLLDEYAEKIGDWSFSAIEAFPEDWTGREIYRFLSEHLGSSRAASEYLNAAGIKGITYEGGQDGRCFVVFDDKAIDILDTFYQGRGGAEARGSVLPTSEGYLISLFSRANLSTLPHEFGHIFRMEMQRAVDMGIADEAMVRDHRIFENWLSRFDDDATLEAEYNERLKSGPAFNGREFSALSPEERARARETAKHEYFARGFEAYLREGKAPTRGLEGAFQRFKKWLMSIYRSARRLGVELNDDVREAFDRMIVAEREMETEAARHELLSLDEKQLDTLGLTGAEREYASGLMKAAIENAAEERARDIEQSRKERLRKFETQAREALLNEPAYAALEAAKRQPLDMEAVIETIGEKDAKALLKRHAGITNEGGMDPELFARERGYENAPAMLADMLKARPLDAEVRKRARILEERAEASLFRPEDYLLSSDKIQEQVELVARYLTRDKPESRIDRQAFVGVAERELAAMPMGRAVNTRRFLADLRRALRRERAALRSGDVGAALKANNQARLNLEFARQSRKARTLRESAQSGIARFLKNKSADADAKFLVMNMAMNHGLGRYNEPLARGRDEQSMTGWIRRMEDAGYEFYFDAGPMLADSRSWSDMSFEEFTNLSDAVKQVAAADRCERQFLSRRDKQSLAEIAKELAAQARREYKVRPRKRVEKAALDTPKKWLRTAHAQLMKVEFLCDMLDGGEHGGVWERTIFRPIAEAESRRDVRLKREVERMRSPELFGRYDMTRLRQKVMVDAVKEAFTLEQRLMVALNMGNDGNYERLKSGFGWTDEQIADIVSSLSKEDWDFVTNIWKYLESFRKESFAVERTLTGIEPRAVEARPFMTRYGMVSGGYFPVAYDPEKGRKAFERAQEKDDKKLLGGRNYGGAQTAHGHLKARSKGGTGEPLDLSFSVIGNHVFDVVHDFTFRIPVMDVAKVLRNRDVQTALSETVGPEQARLFMPWLQDVSMMRRDPASLWEKSLSKARALTTTYGLGHKLTVLVQQGTGYLQTIDMIGLENTARGVLKVFANPAEIPALFRETCELSPFMATRMESFDRDIKDIDRRIIPRRGAARVADAAREWSMKSIGLCQMGVDLGTWWGAYEKRMRETRGDMRESVAYADSVVRMTQGGGGTKDLARIQRGNEALKMVTMFYSFFNVQYNMWARRAHLTKSVRDVPKALNTVFLTAVLGPVLAEMLAGRGPDDDESWLGWGAKLTVTYPFMAIPVLRDVVNGIAGDYGYQMTPLEQTFKRVVRLYDAATDAAAGEEDWSRAGREAAEIGGILSNGLVTQQMVTTAMGIARFLTGDDFELADLARRRRRGGIGERIQAGGSGRGNIPPGPPAYFGMIFDNRIGRREEKAGSGQPVRP